MYGSVRRVNPQIPGSHKPARAVHNTNHIAYSVPYHFAPLPLLYDYTTYDTYNTSQGVVNRKIPSENIIFPTSFF